MEMDIEDTINPFVAGNFGPVLTEDDFALEVQGEIPKELSGVLFRNGPNPQFIPRDPRYHWFEGDGMIHAFTIGDGKVNYRNRFVRTPKFLRDNAAGSLSGGFIANAERRDADRPDVGTANTNAVWHGGKLLAMEELSRPYEIDPLTLETRGVLGEYPLPTTAHPKIDPVREQLVWFGYGVGEHRLTGAMTYGYTEADGRVVRVGDFQPPYSSMVHDFMVTANHVLFPILPLTGSMERAQAGLPPYAWEGDKPAYVGVMRRDADTSTIRWFECEPCFLFHPLNSWEENGKLYCDVMRYDVAPRLPNADGSTNPQSICYLARWTFDLNSNTNVVKVEKLDDLDGEFPRVDPRFETLKHRHGWYVVDSTAAGGPIWDTIAHLDLTSGRRQLFRLPEGDAAMEPVFVPRTADAAEGDGWITAVVHRGRENLADLLIFNALDIEKGPIASARVPRRVPFGFHGNWMDLRS